MIELDTAADSYVLRDRDIQLSFRFVGDRWQHSVAVRRDDRWQTVLTSDEGGPADSKIPSPAFQELRCEQPAEGICEFQLFGRSGKGVYSAAMRYDAADRSVDFDLCARGPVVESSLCTVCTYRLAGFEPIRIEPLPIAGSPASECRLSDVTGESRLAVGCFEIGAATVAAKPASVRWRLRMSLPSHP